MTRHVAFLRGVGPGKPKMADLKRSFEAAGFHHVRTVLSSGNVAFDADERDTSRLERVIEDATRTSLGRGLRAMVRRAADLERLLASDPFEGFDLPAGAKRVVTFLRRPAEPEIVLPLERDGARILRRAGSEVFTACVPAGKGPVFMVLLERTFGTDLTTRTLETVRRCAAASRAD
jgi:uncharacterized protein (DUF1697 family)